MEIAPERCPLCDGPNDCQLCTHGTYRGPCWCMSTDIPEELLALVPEDYRGRACLCRSCVSAFELRQTPKPTTAILTGDHYFTPDGLLVFTAEYHLRRGYCCGNGCRHCPYPPQTARR